MKDLSEPQHWRDVWHLALRVWISRKKSVFVLSQAASVVDFITSSAATEALIYDHLLRFSESPDKCSHQFHHLRLLDGEFCRLFYKV